MRRGEGDEGGREDKKEAGEGESVGEKVYSDEKN